MSLPKDITKKEAYLEKLRTSHLGQIPWNKGTKGIMKPNITSFKKGQNAWNKGKKNEYHLWAGGRVNTPWLDGENNHNWKGDEVGYVNLHTWVYRKLGQPDTCEHCSRSGLKGKQIHWANKSQKYLRDISDWLRLCASCHKKYDLNKKTYA